QLDEEFQGRDRDDHDGPEPQRAQARRHPESTQRRVLPRLDHRAAEGMTLFVQTLIDGIAVGSLYALIALGYTLVYGILKFINFAHSDIFALGAWLSFAVAAAFGLSGLAGAPAPPWYAGLGVLLAAMIGCSVIGLAIERFAYKPLRRAPRLNVLITAIG